MGNQETQQLSEWDPKYAFVGVELEVDTAKVLKGLVQVLNERVLVPGFDHNVTTTETTICGAPF